MQLNPFEVKAEITRVLNELRTVTDFDNYAAHYHLLDMQEDKNIIVKLLFREINSVENKGIVRFLLLRYSPKKELVEHLWSIIKNNLASNTAKIFALDLLRDIDTDWTYEECDKYLDNPDELVDSDTKKILDNAIINPEVQIDFLDFLNSLPDDDKVVLLNSLSNDYSKDELANILIPVFMSSPYSQIGKTALDILGNSKSQLAYHALNYALDTLDEKIQPQLKKNISTLKLAGIREDNSKEFYKNLLKTSKPYKCCITYPDGQGNQAVIFTRQKESGRIQFVAIVINDYKGIRDCFGFNDISLFESNTIIDRFYQGQSVVEISFSVLKSILSEAEKISGDVMPYEYICWKNIMADIDLSDINIKYNVQDLTEEELQDILKSEFTDFWFLNEKYSDEFEEFISLVNNTEPKDFDKIIDENLDNIFYKDEYNIWKERIMHVAVLKHFSNDEECAKKLYSLYNKENLVRELLKNIVRKSIYEYCFMKQEHERVRQIEEMWVN